MTLSMYIDKVMLRGIGGELSLQAHAARSEVYFRKTEIALEVAQFLVDKPTSIDLMKVSFRTLKMGYDFAVTHPDSWQEFFMQVLPKREARSEKREARSEKRIIGSIPTYFKSQMNCARFVSFCSRIYQPMSRQPASLR